jgi:hypothetical protein
MLPSLVQLLPSNESTSEVLVTARQYVVLAQDRSTTPSAPGTFAGSVQVVPSYVSVLPRSSNAVQYVREGQDKATSACPRSMKAGALQCLPLPVSTAPWASPSTQNEALGHATTVGGPRTGSTRTGLPHVASEAA